MSSAIQSSSQTLGEIILQEQQICMALLETVEAERRAIKSLAITEFHTINTRRITILESLRALSESRESAVQHLADAAHLSGPVESLSALLDQWQNPHAATLRRHHSSLMATAKQAREEIKHNVVLIEGIRHFVEGALAASVTAVTGSNAYDKSGQHATLPSLSTVLYQQG